MTCRIPNDTVDNQLVKTVFPFLANNSRVQGNAIAALNLAPIFIHIEESAGIPISVCLAHWAMETGWGSSNRFINNRNFGGIIWKNKTPHWDNVDDAISYWIRVLTQPNYTKYFKDTMDYNDYLNAYALGNYYGSSKEERAFANKNRRIVIENLLHNTYYIDYCQILKNKKMKKITFLEVSKPLIPIIEALISFYKDNNKLNDKIIPNESVDSLLKESFNRYNTSHYSNEDYNFYDFAVFNVFVNIKKGEEIFSSKFQDILTNIETYLNEQFDNCFEHINKKDVYNKTIAHIEYFVKKYFHFEIDISSFKTAYFKLQTILSKKIINEYYKNQFINENTALVLGDMTYAEHIALVVGVMIYYDMLVNEVKGKNVNFSKKELEKLTSHNLETNFRILVHNAPSLEEKEFIIEQFKKEEVNYIAEYFVKFILCMFYYDKSFSETVFILDVPKYITVNKIQDFIAYLENNNYFDDY